jgi:adenylylsulfate kinase
MLRLIMSLNTKNIKRQKSEVTFDDRKNRYGQSPVIFWFTGLSGAGKTTIASAFEKRLFDKGCIVYHMDADDVRRNLNADLGFSMDARFENIRRAAAVARILQDAGNVVLAAFITPTEKSRMMVHQTAMEDLYVEVFVKASLETCIQRDPKGFYKRAMDGEIPNFTGIESIYEVPRNPDIILDTQELNPEECVNRLMKIAVSKGVIQE